jgi:hypothetical protein
LMTEHATIVASRQVAEPSQTRKTMKNAQHKARHFSWYPGQDSNLRP